jgi:hypothetical protein
MRITPSPGVIQPNGTGMACCHSLYPPDVAPA